MITRRLAALLVLAAALTGPAAAGDVVDVAPRPIDLTVQDRDGADRRLADLGGRLTLVHFWASWCASCRTEFPAIDALQRDYRDRGVRVAAISLDRLGWPVIDKTAADLGIREVTLLHDRDRVTTRAAAVVGLPTTLLVDRSGHEVARVTGAGEWSDPAVRARIDALLAN